MSNYQPPKVKWRAALLNGKPHIIKKPGEPYSLLIYESGGVKYPVLQIFGQSINVVISRMDRVLNAVNGEFDITKQGNLTER